jgi:hypothetical protein
MMVKLCGKTITPDIGHWCELNAGHDGPCQGREYNWMVGDVVQSVSGYRWPGVVVARFETLAGNARVVIEGTVTHKSGCLDICIPAQIRGRKPE